MHVDDELLSGDDRLVGDMVQKLKQQFLVKNVDFLKIWGRKVERTKFAYRPITSSRHIYQSLKDMHMERRNPVSTRGLQMTEKDVMTEKQLPAVLAALYRRVTGRLVHVAGHRPDASRERAFKGQELSNKRSLGTSETRHA